MADAVAVLGIAVESAEAERNMRNFEAVAKRTGESVEQVAARFKKMRDEAKGLPAPLKDASNEAARQANQFQQMATGSKAAEVAISGLSRIIGGMVSTMVTGGVAGITAAITTYALEALGTVRNLDEKIKQHAELVRTLRDAYGEAGKGIDVAAKESQNVLRALLAISTDKLQQDFERLAKSAAAPGQQMAQFVDDFGRIIEAGTDKFAPFRKAIDDFNASVRAGKPDVIAFRNAVSDTVNNSTDQKVRALGDELLTASKNAGNLASNLDASKRAITDLAEAAKAINDKNFADGLKTLSGTVTKSLTDRERIEKNYQDLMKNANTDAKQMAAMAERDNQLAILSYNGRKKAAEEAAKAQESAVKRFQTAIGSYDKHIAGVNAQIDAVGKGAGELAKLQTQYRLTEAAQQAFGTVSAETAAKIAKVAEAAGEAAQKLALARLASDIKFDRSQIGLSDSEASANAQLRRIFGDDLTSAQAQFYKQQLLINDALRQYSDIGKDATKGFISDILAGKSALESIGNALQRVGDKLISMAADGLWGKAFGGLGGGSGFNLLSLLGGGGPSIGTTSATAGASSFMMGGISFPKFANGTDSAPGGWSIVGEQGPELLRLPRGAGVTSNDNLKQMMQRDGGSNVIHANFSPTYNIQGSGPEIQQLRQQMLEDRANFEARVKKTVREAQYGGSLR